MACRDSGTSAVAQDKGVDMIHSLGRRARNIGIGIATMSLAVAGVLVGALGTSFRWRARRPPASGHRAAA